MKNFKYSINRPEYIFQPNRIITRLMSLYFGLNEESKSIKLPCGLDIDVSSGSNDVVVKALKSQGIYDLSITEVLWRLLSPGEMAIDIGANIGYMTSIMIKKVGKNGQIWCFEPNPEVYQELIGNLNLWKQVCQCNVFTHKIALSRYDSEGILNIPIGNRGEAFIKSDNQTRQDIKKSFKVEMKRLDTFFPSDSTIGLIKLDVEGHELEVLQGAEKLIEQHNVRDILFEEHRTYPTPVTQYLESNGYTVFKIWKGFLHPLLLSPSDSQFHPWEASNYLATSDPNRALTLLKSIGWQSLRGEI
jgi:FkbM family methyltransferase